MKGDPRSEAIERLLGAWRGEMEARAFYELLAEREGARDPDRGRILRELADAEAGHRARIEARLAELGQPVPDPSSVRLSRWQRWQARLAPVERVLAAREAAEDEEVLHRYATPTGDAATDRLLSEIRRDEAGHSRTVQRMRSGAAPEAEPRAPGVGRAGAPQARLDRILGRERWHQSGGSWISGAIYGANDGLAAVFGIVSGVSGATGGGSNFVLTAGLAGAIASALSMATGAYLAERSEAEVAHANLEQERREILEHPDEEREELSLFYQLKGVPREDADAIVERIARDPDAMLNALAAEELGGSGSDSNPVQAGLAGGISTALGAFIPVIPFFWLKGTEGIVVAAIVSLVAHFAVGAAKALFTLRTWWAAGLEMTLAGVIVGGATYGVGLVFPSVT